jgi:hypothetical protein
MQETKKDYHQLSLLQKLRFLVDVENRLKKHVPRRNQQFLGLKDADTKELLCGLNFFRSLSYASQPDNQRIMASIYRSLNPRDQFSLPSNLRCYSIVMMFFIQTFNQYRKSIDVHGLYQIVELGLLKLGVINTIEANKLPSIYEYDEKNVTFLFTFQEKRFRCVLNPMNKIGCELTLLPDLKLDESNVKLKGGFSFSE